MMAAALVTSTTLQPKRTTIASIASKQQLLSGLTALRRALIAKKMKPTLLQRAAQVRQQLEAKRRSLWNRAHANPTSYKEMLQSPSLSSSTSSSTSTSTSGVVVAAAAAAAAAGGGGTTVQTVQARRDILRAHLKVFHF